MWAKPYIILFLPSPPQTKQQHGGLSSVHTTQYDIVMIMIGIEHSSIVIWTSERVAQQDSHDFWFAPQ